MSRKYIMIETAIDNAEKADELVNEILKNKIAVGCQVVPAGSKWWWKGKIEASKEYLIFIKTRKDKVNKVYNIVKKVHTYDVFEFAQFKLESVSTDYLFWFDSKLSKRKKLKKKKR